MTDIIFCHSGLFFTLLSPYEPRKSKFWKNEKNTWWYHFTNVYHKWQSYDVWFPRYRVQETEFFCHFGLFFAHLPTNNPKNQNFEKMKKPPEDIIILQRCNINGNHVMYGSWDTKCNRQIFLSFWNIFCPITPLTTQKIKILKKMKEKLRDITILTMYTKNDIHMMYDSWNMERDGHNFLSF